jgi:hypothetical protein
MPKRKMTVRNMQYNESQRCYAQFPLRAPKGKPTQERWIVAVWGKDRFSLRSCVWDGRDIGGWDYDEFSGDYSQLWIAMAGLCLDGRKWWLIGHGTSYALDRANFTDALECGDVSLPKVAKGKNKGKHGGKLTLSSRITEVDVCCGRNKIKLLDWQNFAVEPPKPIMDAETLSLQHCCERLQTFLRTQSLIQVQVNKTTAAQLGWSKARTTEGVSKLWVNFDPSCRALERRSYHAGRNECFSLGMIPGTTFSLDVKSCYATICRDESLPIRMIEEYRHGCDVDKIDASGPDHWIADVVVRAETPDYPLAWEGTPIYPVGQFRTSLPWPELKLALEAGSVVRVLRAAKYDAAPILREYAEWYLRSRVEVAVTDEERGNPPLKAMFNASLGYTARQKYEWQPWDTHIGFPYWLGIASSPEDKATPVQAQKLDTERRWLRVDGEPREAMPFLHAAICSYARVRLLEIFEAAGRENVLYCDTDGLLLTERGVAELTDDARHCDGLPFGLVQRFNPGRAFIQGQKSYRVGDRIIHAGVVDTRMSALATASDPIAVGSEEKMHPGVTDKRHIRVLTCKTGVVKPDGTVRPFRFRCDDSGGEGREWVNEMLR